MPKEAEAARDLAMQAFLRIAADPEMVQSFMASTGTDPVGLRAMAGRPGFALFVLDFIAEQDDRMVEMARMLEIRPESIARARVILDPASRGEFA
ncbi:DUF3572 family protein [Paracoccus pacificus]|uniref:DUF3572 family protein n=1 Tax=Paracoccus pacificus TaxID=1463598 RepID=A0ABW4R470_9RHOB